MSKIRVANVVVIKFAWKIFLTFLPTFTRNVPYQPSVVHFMIKFHIYLFNENRPLRGLGLSCKTITGTGGNGCKYALRRHNFHFTGLVSNLDKKKHHGYNFIFGIFLKRQLSSKIYFSAYKGKVFFQINC